MGSNQRNGARSVAAMKRTLLLLAHVAGLRADATLYTDYMSVKSRDNTMLDMGTAYRVDRSGFRDVDILSNRVSTKYNGVDLRFNDGAAHVLVQGNDITFGDNPACTTCRGYHGIYVNEGSMKNTSSRILGNTIHYLAQHASREGIGLIAADDWLVASNTLLMSDNAHNRTGITLKGCRRPEVSCNTITGASSSYPVDAQAAIRNALGNDVLISCNEVDSTANGILFNGVAPDTEVRGNKLRNHRWALHLDSTAVIGGQTLKGNLWYNAAAAGGLGALYEDTLNAFANLFLVNPATISGGSSMPPSVAPNGWFDITSGLNYDCADDEGEDYCVQFQERGKENLTELDERVAEDSLENDPYTAETKWMLKGRLYKKLDDNPELQDSLQVMADMYEELQWSTIAALKAIDDELLVLYALDSSTVAQLQTHRAHIDSLLGLLQDRMAQLGDSTLTNAQREAVAARIVDYHENIRELSNWSTSVLFVATSAKESGADGLKAANMAVTVSELVEANQKQVNEIYLASIGKDVDVFTPEQAVTLFDIANQCPMVGGNAVFKARSLYWLIDDSHDFDDPSLCLPHGIVVKRLMHESGNVVKIIPNPASDEASVLLTRTLEQTGSLVLYDALGSEVLRVTVPKYEFRIPFSTATLTPALYHYRMHGNAGIIGEGKLSIIR